MEVAYAIEAAGGTADGFAEVLAQAERLASGYRPARLTDVARGYRFAVADSADGTSGEPMGVYKGVVILAWATGI